MIITKDDVGKLVRYYDEGYRVGTLDDVRKTTVWIKPLKPIGGKQPHAVSLDIESIIGFVEEKHV